MLSVVDEASCCMKSFCLRTRSDTKYTITNYIVKTHAQFVKKVKFGRHDGARRFVTNSLKKFCEDKGIEQQTTVPYTHQTNGTAERAIRTIFTIERSLLHQSKLDKCFWAEAARMAITVKTVCHRPISHIRHHSILSVGRSQASSTYGHSDVKSAL